MTEQPEFSEDAETRGWAHVGLSLSFAILVGLRRNGVISDTVFRDILDVALASVETTQAQYPDDESLKVARKALDGMF